MSLIRLAEGMRKEAGKREGIKKEPSLRSRRLEEIGARGTETGHTREIFE